MAVPLNPVATLGLDESRLQRLATELAREMYEPEDILKMFGVDAGEVGELLERSVSFQQMYREAYTLWHSMGGIKERIEIKSQIVLEQALDKFDGDLHDPNHPLSARVELAKFLAGQAKLINKDGTAQAQVGDRVILNIYFKGHDPVRLAKEISIVGTPKYEEPDRVIEEVTTVVTP